MLMELPKDPAAQDDTTTMLADANTLLTGVNTVIVDTNTTFEMQGFNLDSIMQDAEVMEFDLLDNTSGQPIYHQQEMQVVGTFDNIQELQKAFEVPTSKPKPSTTRRHVMGPKRLPDELLPPKNKDNILRCREYRKNKNTKLDKEQVELEQLEIRNQELRQEEEEMTAKLAKLQEAYLKLIQKGRIKFV